MKRLLTICVMLFMTVVGATAQINLSISTFFEESSVYTSDAKTVWVEGRELKSYHLTLYRSISSENPKTVKDMEQAVNLDSKRAADKEIGYIGSRLYYAFLSLPPVAAGSSLCRYIFYRNASLKSKEKKDATLVYMEGNVSMQELKKLFK